MEVHDFVSDDFTKSRYAGETKYFSLAIFFLRRSLAIIRSRRADLIWIQREAMPWLPFWVENLLLGSKPRIYDFDDAIHIQYGQHRRNLVRFFLGKKIAKIAQSADCIIVGNQDLKRYMEEVGATDVVVIPSVIDVAPSGQLRARPKTRPFTFCYTGNIYEDFQDPEPLFHALHEMKTAGELSSNSVSIRFLGTRFSRVEKLALDERYSEFIQIEGHVTREAALAAQQEADALLLLEDSDEQSRGILTGKVFEYLVSGTPILCIGSRSEFELGDLLHSTGTGIVVPPENFKGLRALLLATLNGGGLFEQYKPDFEEILRYSRETQANDLLDAIVERINQKTKLFLSPKK